MSVCRSNNIPNVNETIIIESPNTGGTMDMCWIYSCSGTSAIFLGNSIVLYGDTSATTINASIIYSGGTDLNQIFSKNNYYTTGTTLDGKIIYYNRNDELSAYTTDLSSLFTNISASTISATSLNSLSILSGGTDLNNIFSHTDRYTSGATLVGNVVYFNRSDIASAYTLNLSASSSVHVTGLTFNNNYLTLFNSDNTTLFTNINSFTGLTVNGIISASTINSNNILSANTNINNIFSKTDFYTTGATFSAGEAIFTRNDGYNYDLNLNIFSATSIDTATLSSGGTNLSQIFTPYLNQDLDYYINPDRGNDSNTGDSTHPFLTINKAISLLPLNLGSYSVNITLQDSLNYIENNITINSFYNGNIIIGGASIADNVLFTPPDSSPVFNITSCNSFTNILNLSIRLITDNSSCLYVSSSNAQFDSLKLGDHSNSGTTGINSDEYSDISFSSTSDIDDNKVSVGIIGFGSTIRNLDNSTFGDSFLSLSNGSVYINDGVNLDDKVNKSQKINGISFTGDITTPNYYTTGGTYSNGIETFTRNDGGTYTVNLGALSATSLNSLSILSGGTDLNNIFSHTDRYTSGATLVGNVVYFNRSDIASAYTLNLSAFTSVHVTGLTFNNNYLTLFNSDNTTLFTNINSFTGLTVNGIISASTINSNNILSANTDINNIFSKTDFYTTGATFSAGEAIFTRNDGYNYDLNLNIFSATSIDTATLSSGGTDLNQIFSKNNYYTTGTTLDGKIIYYNCNDELSAYTTDLSSLFTNISASTISATSLNSLSILSGGTDLNNIFSHTDRYTSGATLVGNVVYFNRSDIASAYTLNLSAFTSVHVTGLTFNNNYLTLFNSDNTTLFTNINSFTGLTVNGIISASTINSNNILSANTDINNIFSKTDFYTTGATFSAGEAIFTRNDGYNYDLNLNIFSATSIDTATLSSGGTNLSQIFTPYLNQDLDYYINPDRGNDSNTGDSTHPFLTINKAISLLPLNLGSYSVNITLQDSLNYIENNITINSFYNGNIIIGGASIADNVLFTPPDSSPVFNITSCNSFTNILNLSIRLITDNSSCLYVSSSNAQFDSLKLGDHSNSGTTGINSDEYSDISFSSTSDIDDNKVSVGIIGFGSTIRNLDNSTFGDSFLSLSNGSVYINDGVNLDDKVNKSQKINGISFTGDITTPNYYTTGGTYSNGIETFTRNDGGTYTVNLGALSATSLNSLTLQSGNTDLNTIFVQQNHQTFWDTLSTGNYLNSNSFTFTGSNNDIFKYNYSLFQALSSAQTITVTTSSSTINLTSHMHVDNDIALIVGGTAPSGLTLSTPYYLINTSVNNFRLSSTPSGSSITLSSSGSSPTISFLKTGFVTGITLSNTTITANTITDYSLVSGDNNFKLSNTKIFTDYQKNIFTGYNGVIADSANSQGVFDTNTLYSQYLLASQPTVRTQASGAGASCSFNVYDNNTALYNTPPDLGSGTTLSWQIPNVKYIGSSDNYSMRIISSTGATNVAASFQLKNIIVPIEEFLRV